MTAAPVTTATLEAFSDAWNRHDIDDLMTFMSEDCVFQTAAGPDACGTPPRGREAVRRPSPPPGRPCPMRSGSTAGISSRGDCGVSQWTFTGTAADGSRIETDGIDVFTFKDGKIALKNVFRKARPQPAGRHVSSGSLHDDDRHRAVPQHGQALPARKPYDPHYDPLVAPDPGAGRAYAPT